MKRTRALTIGSFIIAVLVFLSGGDQVWAQQEHAHESPHGGEVHPMGNHHVEFLVVEGANNKGDIVIYLLDANLNPVSVDKNKMEGIVYLTLPDKSKRTLKLIATTEILASSHQDEGEEHKEGETHEEGKEDVPHFQAEVDLKGIDTFDAVVSLRIGEKRNNLRFKYVRGEQEHQEGEEHHEKKDEH
ncbi:MAG: hypothetical protein ACC651_06340 [Candidatus Scalindua sp.]